MDCLVGFTISPILWANISRKSGLSAGRCQTPALRLIYDNQQEINNAPGRIAYDTTGYSAREADTLMNMNDDVYNKSIKSLINFSSLISPL